MSDGHTPGLIDALLTILATRPEQVMNGDALVGDPHAFGWNVHMIARAAIAKATGEVPA